jgi:hypothetical protein
LHPYAHSEFAARAGLYAEWDRKLHPKTRFFGAAAVTNAALVELCSLRYSKRWLGPAAGLLSTIGRHLERLNIEIAERILHGTQSSADLDRSLVVLEQAALEQVLQQEARRTPGGSHVDAIHQINGLLLCVEWWSVWPSNRWPCAQLYRHVLRAVRVNLGRRPNFAALSDRVNIGHTLIRALP